MKITVCLIGWLILLGTLAANAEIGDTSGGELRPVSIRHPISIVEADIYVNRFRTTARLKCFADDLEILQGVEPLDDGFYDPDELVDATKDHAKYLAEKITLRNSAGELMPAKVTEIVHFEIPQEGISSGHLMNYQMGFELEFNYETPPEFITIQQEMIAEGALLPSELKILLKQAGSDVPYTHMMKPQQPETFRFDWERPVLSEEASEKEWEEWFAEQREKTLGITSYSSVYSFIYVTNFEVRHEVLIPLATLATMTEFDRADISFLDVDEQAAAAEKIKALFSVGNPVTIDSVQVAPVFDRIDFYGLDLTDFAIQAEKRRVSMANGRVGLIMSYSTKGPPTSVDVTWDKFNTVVKSVDSVVFAFDKTEKTQFSMFLENNTYHWQSPARQPLPPITGIAATIDRKAFQQPMWHVPVVSLGLGVLGLLGLLLKPVLGSSWQTTGWVAVSCAIAAMVTGPFFRRSIENPFVKAPPFQIDDKNAEQVFAQLHKNMFRAFDYHNESDVYDALAKSVDGALLRELYLQINQSLRIKEQGGAVARIDEVKLLDGHQEPMSELPKNQAAFKFRCRWNLIGTIEHWGHIHQRINQYEANFVVWLKDDAWKITEMGEFDEEPGQVKTSLRKF